MSSNKDFKGFKPPIVTQPGRSNIFGDRMPIPSGNMNCPRGLEYLTTVDQLFVKQETESLETSRFGFKKKYLVKNSLDQKVYFAVEDVDCCSSYVCSIRPFDNRIFDNYQNEVIHLNDPSRCRCCGFSCGLEKIEVSAPPGNVIGSIQEEWSVCIPSFKIKNQRNETVLRIQGPIVCHSRIDSNFNVEFKVLSLTGEQVGKILKRYSGVYGEIFPDGDFIGITFPMNLNEQIKAVLLGAAFAIDSKFF